MAGTLKPNSVGSEGTWLVNSAVDSASSDAKNDLFDGLTGLYGSVNTFYWNSSSTYLDITLNQKSRIWTIGNASWVQHNNSLKIEKWNGTSFISFGSTPNSSLNWSVMGEFEKGRYKFSLAVPTLFRMDDEWFIESIGTNKILILSNDKYASIVKGGYIENAIPTMTSHTSPSGIVSSNNESRASWQAFDKSKIAGNGWMTDGATETAWLAYEFPEPKVIVQYTITVQNDSTYNSRSPKAWTFEGWNGTSWVVLDTQTNFLNTTWASLLGTKTIPLSNRTSYIKYRVNVTERTGTSYISIQELDMKEYIPDVYKVTQVQSEQNFINHGMDKSVELDLSVSMSKKSFVNQTSTTLGNGKVFTKTIDTLQLPIKKIEIK